MSKGRLNIVLRQAWPEDVAHIAALFSRSRATLTFLPRLYSAKDDLAFWRDHVMPQLRVTVAENGSELVGVMAEGDGFLHHLYVEPSEMGRGVGTMLLRDAQARLEEIQLWCFADNSAARRFYERHGFVAVEATTGADNEEKCPDVRYHWHRPVA